MKACCTSAAFVFASRIAAMMRSASVSVSSGSHDSGLMTSPTSSPVPLIVAVTRPPPAVPVSSVVASLSWALCSWDCMAAACAIRSLRLKFSTLVLSLVVDDLGMQHLAQQAFGIRVVYIHVVALTHVARRVSGRRRLGPRAGEQVCVRRRGHRLSLIHISEPTRLLSISYAVFCLKKKKK